MTASVFGTVAAENRNRQPTTNLFAELTFLKLYAILMVIKTAILPHRKEKRI